MMDAAEGCSTWYASTLNKPPGQALRLSAVLTFLHWWAEPEGTPVSKRIDGAQMQEAIILMSAYFLHQARRVRQTAAVGDGEADARAVLAVIRERKWERFTGWQLQRVSSGRLADTRNRKAACEILVEAGLLREASSAPARPRAGRGRSTSSTPARSGAGSQPIPPRLPEPATLPLLPPLLSNLLQAGQGHTRPSRRTQSIAPGPGLPARRDRQI